MTDKEQIDNYIEPFFAQKSKYIAMLKPLQHATRPRTTLLSDQKAPLVSELIRIPIYKRQGDISRSRSEAITRFGDYISGITLVIDKLTDSACTPWSIVKELRVDIGEKNYMKLDSVKLRTLLELFKLKWTRIGNKMFIPVPFELCTGGNIHVLRYLAYHETRVHVHMHEDVDEHILDNMVFEVRYGYINMQKNARELQSRKNVSAHDTPVLEMMRTLLEIEIEERMIRTKYPIRGHDATSAIFFYFTERGKLTPIPDMLNGATINIAGHDMVEMQSIESLVHQTSSLISVPNVYCIFETGSIQDGCKEHHGILNLDGANDVELRIEPSDTLKQQYENYELHMFSLNTLECTYDQGRMTSRMAV
jgi:hypothetical protein